MTEDRRMANISKSARILSRDQRKTPVEFSLLAFLPFLHAVYKRGCVVNSNRGIGQSKKNYSAVCVKCPYVFPGTNLNKNRIYSHDA